jgi:hypothetical protein
MTPAAPVPSTAEMPSAETTPATEVSSATAEMAATAMPAAAPHDLDSAALGFHALLERRSRSGRNRSRESNGCE